MMVPKASQEIENCPTQVPRKREAKKKDENGRWRDMQLNCDDWGVHCSFMDRMWICWVPLPTQLLCQNEFHHTQLEHCLNSQESSKLWKILFCNNQIVRFFNNLFMFKSSVEVNGKLYGNLRQAHHRSGSGDSFYSLPLFLFSLLSLQSQS